MKTTSSRQNLRASLRDRAFTGVDLLVGIFTLALLAAAVLPMLTLSHHTSHGPRIRCTNNLKQIGIAYRSWASDHGDKYPMQVAVANGGTMGLTNAGQAYVHFLVMSNELSTPMILHCTQDSRRTNARSFSSLSDHSLSYLVGVDAQCPNPRMILSGDDYLSVSGQTLPAGLNHLGTNSNVAWGKGRHIGAGNLGLADGSVIQLPAASLSAVFTATGNATNRLLLP